MIEVYSELNHLSSAEAYKNVQQRTFQKRKFRKEVFDNGNLIF